MTPHRTCLALGVAFAVPFFIIVSPELGGSNDVANLYPEKANPHPGFHVKDKLGNRLRDLVCDGTMTLRIVQRQIAANWQALYKKVYGTAP
ncbi:MAG: hypothetical protein ACXVH1_30540 [Solirubrobacteraceae bacterium]